MKHLLEARAIRVHRAVFVLIALAGCGDNRVVGRDGEDLTVDRHEELLAQLPQMPHKRVCNGPGFACGARVRTDAAGNIVASVVPSGLAPVDLQSAYGIPTTGGAGITIAVVDAFNYPNAESDLAAFRSQFALPPCTQANGCLKIVNSSGQTAPLPSNSPAGDDWTVEAALDLQMASTGCPNCKLILVEATSDQDNSLFASQNGAASIGANIISDSWGGPDDGNSVSYESQYFTHTGVSIFVSSGDSGNTGSTPDYPSTSAHVTAVGGTSLIKNTGTARGWSEGTWSLSGSSCSKLIAKPTYQTNAACTKRAAADVSAVADPNTGVAVYNAGSGGWIVVGGTSASAPLVAAIYASSGHAGAGPDYSYSHLSEFYDVITGTNGSCSGAMCHAGAGWDGPTGNGTPNGAALSGTTCAPQCTNKTCGSDGCGGTCGTCPSGETCSTNGQCQVSNCTPNCTGKTCGSDGCGGTCGTCPNGTCSASGTCSSGGTCAHPICSTGVSETASCDPCATEICAVDSYCCTTSWDSICVGEVSSVCNESCSGGGGGGTCAHSECNAGKKEKSGCDTCVSEICAVDSYCCTTRWDSICVSEVGSVCGESCPL